MFERLPGGLLLSLSASRRCQGRRSRVLGFALARLGHTRPEIADPFPRWATQVSFRHATPLSQGKRGVPPRRGEALPVADAMDSVVAHGLLNSLGTMRLAAMTLRERSRDLDDATWQAMRRIVREQAELFAAGLSDLAVTLPDEMADRAARLVLASCLMDDSRPAGDTPGSVRLLSVVISTGFDVSEDLKKVMWGYDREALAVLDEVLGDHRPRRKPDDFVRGVSGEG